MKYTATEQDMQSYSRIISALTQLDIQREQYMQQLSQWEKEHTVPEEQAHVASEEKEHKVEENLEEDISLEP